MDIFKDYINNLKSDDFSLNHEMRRIHQTMREKAIQDEYDLDPVAFLVTIGKKIRRSSY